MTAAETEAARAELIAKIKAKIAERGAKEAAGKEMGEQERPQPEAPGPEYNLRQADPGGYSEFSADPAARQPGNLPGLRMGPPGLLQFPPRPASAAMQQAGKRGLVDLGKTAAIGAAGLPGGLLGAVLAGATSVGLGALDRKLSGGKAFSPVPAAVDLAVGAGPQLLQSGAGATAGLVARNAKTPGLVALANKVQAFLGGKTAAEAAQARAPMGNVRAEPMPGAAPEPPMPESMGLRDNGLSTVDVEAAPAPFGRLPSGPSPARLGPGEGPPGQIGAGYPEPPPFVTPRAGSPSPAAPQIARGPLITPPPASFRPKPAPFRAGGRFARRPATVPTPPNITEPGDTSFYGGPPPPPSPTEAMVPYQEPGVPAAIPPQPNIDYVGDSSGYGGPPQGVIPPEAVGPYQEPLPPVPYAGRAPPSPPTAGQSTVEAGFSEVPNASFRPVPSAGVPRPPAAAAPPPDFVGVGPLDQIAAAGPYGAGRATRTAAELETQYSRLMQGASTAGQFPASVPAAYSSSATELGALAPNLQGSTSGPIPGTGTLGRLLEHLGKPPGAGAGFVPRGGSPNLWLGSMAESAARGRVQLIPELQSWINNINGIGRNLAPLASGLLQAGRDPSKAP